MLLVNGAKIVSNQNLNSSTQCMSGIVGIPCALILHMTAMSIYVYPHETALICLPDIVNNWLVLISVVVFLVVYCVVVPLCAKGAQILVIQPWSENPS